MDMFLLYPTLVEDCIPGDHFTMGLEMVCRMNPLVVPILDEISISTQYFFVPYRLLWDDFENYITGGRDGKYTADIPRHSREPTVDYTPGSLWDHLGFNTEKPGFTIKKWPIKFPWRAYNLIWSEYYRDQNLLEEIEDLDEIPSGNQNLRKRAWAKDYFTSALPWQQRGEAQAFPISGNLNAVWDIGNFSSQSGSPPGNIIHNNVGMPGFSNGQISSTAVQNSAPYLKGIFDNNTVDMSEAVTFGVDDLRFGVQLQRYMERLARVGSRYTEFLRGIFGVNPKDDRMQRPEFIGSVRSPIIISEVLQTSSSDTTSPQGNMAGHGIVADRTFAGKYFVREHGCIMGITSIMPKTMYKDGIERVWFKDSKWDWFLPQFVDLSEQAIIKEELYNYNEGFGKPIHGYQGRYDEYRYKPSTVHGLFKDDEAFRQWHLARDFTNGAPPPELNQDFIYPTDEEMQDMKRMMAVRTEPAFLVSIGNKVHATRPMPWAAEPGRMDHN